MLRNLARVASKLPRTSALSMPARFSSNAVRCLSSMHERLTTEADSYDRLLNNTDPLAVLKNSSATVVENDITVSFDGELHRVVVSLTKEFDYREMTEEEYAQTQRENSDEANEDEVDEVAFHPITASFTPLSSGAGAADKITVVGEMHPDGRCLVSEITPHCKATGNALRTISLGDLDEGSSTAIFEALEACGLHTTAIEAITKHARRLRIQEHVDALKAINEFVLKSTTD